MGCRVLSSRQLPHQPKLFLDYLERFERVKAFYAYPPTMQAVSREARKLNYPSDRRAEVAALLRTQNVAFGAGRETISNLERLEEGAVAVVTGQQVAVFWMATEDHDLEEVRQTTWFDRGKLIRFELPVAAEAGRPVGQIPLGREAGPLVHEAAELLANQGSDLLAQYLIESYGPEETYGSAFGKLFARLFAEQGLILMDPLDQGLHKVAAPLYQHALAERDALNEKLLERGKELDRAGFAPQVKVTSRGFGASHARRAAELQPECALPIGCAGLFAADRGIHRRTRRNFLFCAVGGDLPGTSGADAGDAAAGRIHAGRREGQ